jgi:hypothetical protein
MVADCLSAREGSRFMRSITGRDSSGRRPDASTARLGYHHVRKVSPIFEKRRDVDGSPDERANSAAAKDAGAGEDTWEELGRQLSELGGAIGRAVQAAVDDPENRKRAGELRDGLLSLADAVGTALDDAGESPQGQRMKEEFSKVARTVADASRKAADDVRPHLIGAAKTASEKLKEAAAGLERRAGQNETAAGQDETTVADAGGDPA